MCIMVQRAYGMMALYCLKTHERYIHSFTYLSMHPYFFSRSYYLSIHSYIIHSSTHLYSYIFINLSIHSSVLSLIYSSIYSFIYFSIHPSILSLIYSSIYSLIHFFIHPSIHQLIHHFIFVRFLLWVCGLPVPHHHLSPNPNMASFECKLMETLSPQSHVL